MPGRNGKEFGIATHFGAGARNKTPADKETLTAQKADLRRIVQTGRAMLEDGESPLKVAVHTVRLAEDSGSCNAGRSPSIRRKLFLPGTPLEEQYEPYIELDAAAMDGETGRFASVVGVRSMFNPVLAAELILHQIPQGETVGNYHGQAFAEAAARMHDLPTYDEQAFLAEGITPYRWQLFQEWKTNHMAQRAHLLQAGITEQPPLAKVGDTVGTIVYVKDSKKARPRFAAAASTGGRLGAFQGRSSDLGTMGAGVYAEKGASCTSGAGEPIVAHGTAIKVLERSRTTDRPLHVTAQVVIDQLASKHNGQGGLLVFSRDLQFGVAHTTELMPHAFWWTGLPQEIVRERAPRFSEPMVDTLED